MKKCLLSLGLSAAILVTAAFAQSAESKLSSVKEASPALPNVKMQQGDGAALVSSKISDGFKRQAAFSAAKRKPVIKHTATYASANPDKAVIKLVVGDCWNDGSGYQVLIDAEALLCDAVSELAGFYAAQSDTYYNMAEFKIPANASAVLGTTSVMDLQSDSVELEPGIYDMLVINPSLKGKNIYAYIPPGKTRLNNIVLEKGYTYVIEVIWLSDREGETVTLTEPFGFRVEAIGIPDFSCEAGTEMNITLTVANSASMDMENYEVWYFSAREGIDTIYRSDTVKEMVGSKLEVGKTINYTFQSKLENIVDNSRYVIFAGVTPPANEYTKEDNVSARYFIKKASQDKLPYLFDLKTYDFLPTLPNTWLFGTSGDGSYMVQSNSKPGTPLVSGCFELEAGKRYRLTYNYWAGAMYYGMELREEYHVAFGPVSKPMSQWDTLVKEKDLLVEDWIYKEVLLNPETTGTYALYFSSDLIPYMGLKDISVAEVTDKDARLVSVNPGLARLMPASQANGGFTATANVQNKGKYPLMGTVEVTMNGKVVGSAPVENVATDVYAEVKIPITLSGLKFGDKPVFNFTVKQEGETQVGDNTFEWEMEVGDYVMAYDYVTEEMCGTDANCVGTSDERGISVGIPFFLTERDTLTAVQLAWGERPEMTIGIRIQKWNANSKILGAVIFENEFRRGASAGIREYALPSIILEAGDYMISAVQQKDAFYSLVTDRRRDIGGLYITSSARPTFQNNYGTPHIRAVFGPDAKPVAKDVMVQSIPTPNDKGLFAENQSVTAKVMSLGYESVQVPVTLMVDGQVISTKTVNFQGYGCQEVRFTADLTAPGTRELKVFAALEGDEDPINDTCIRTIFSMPPPNPYVMDFEYCEDFAIDNFTPAWKTVDVDRKLSYEIANVDFPHSGERFAFIAFNPQKAHSNSLQPHSGDRFGAAFSTETGSNNDWLISPKLKIAAGREYMNFFVRGYSEKTGVEKYNVLVSTTEDILDNFVKIGETREAPFEWTEVSVDLKAYSGKEVYLAIQCVSENAFIFMIDDITVGTRLSNRNVAEVDSRLSLYPNPAREMITIHAQEDVLIQRVEILSISGMTVYQSKTLNTTDYRYSVQGLNAGIYFARVTTDKGMAVMKFIVR